MKVYMIMFNLQPDLGVIIDTICKAPIIRGHVTSTCPLIISKGVQNKNELNLGDMYLLR